MLVLSFQTKYLSIQIN